MSERREIKLTVLPPHPCPYLPGRAARFRGFLSGRMAGEMFHGLLDAGFRRSGRLVYRPDCVGCRECRAMRISVERFAMSKSQRRVWRRNGDLVVTAAKAQASAEKFALYQRYVREWHGKEEDATAEAFVSFLYESPVETMEMEYRDGSGRLLAVGICDRSWDALSSVYFYFDPAAARRGLGTFGVLWEMAYARREKIGWYYLGYWVANCGAMKYKSGFGPHEMLGDDGAWHAAAEWPAG